jgi:signal transduction histidine kinase
METENITTHALRWRFDVHAFRLLGRDLITDRVTALFELVKNAYDADATEVYVEFYNVKTLSEHSKIIIRDNGEGMSLEDIQNKWMVVGTNSKRTRTHSPKFNRRLVGEKGIGRFAVDKLGGYLKLRTKIEGKEEVTVTIDWGEYEKAAEKKLANEQMILFTEIDNPVSYSENTIKTSGTVLEISNLHEIWSDKDLLRLNLELSKIVSPFKRGDNFEILLKSEDIAGFEIAKPIQNTNVNHYSDSFILGFDLDNKTQDYLFFDDKEGKVVVKKKNDFYLFGPLALQLYHFDENAKKQFNKEFNKLGVYIDGIKIYRDGVITTPFAEVETQQDKKRDVLGIDKRLWRDTFNKVGTREIIGFLDLSKDNNPKIIEATNRQDFLNNEEYIELKAFIVKQLQEIEKYKKYKRDVNILKAENNLKKAEHEIKEFVHVIEQLEIDNPIIGTFIQPLKRQAKKASSAISEGRIQAEKIKKEAERRENIYISLMSIQDYAANVAHAVRTSLSAIKEYAEFFKKRFPDPNYDELFLEYAISIYNEMGRLEKAIDFMLSYAKSNNTPEDFNLKELITDLLSNYYKLRFEKEKISIFIEIKDDIPINANKKFIEDIFQNLVANSIKALQNIDDKKIKCSGYVENGQFTCFFSDNGIGIKDEDKEDVFDLYFTTTSEQGGAGLGLYIVKTRLEALKGTIKLIDNEFIPNGTTFKITLPFNKK